MLTEKNKTLLKKYKYFVSLYDTNEEKYDNGVLRMIEDGLDFDDSILIARLLLDVVGNYKQITHLLEKYYEYYDSLPVEPFSDPIEFKTEDDRSIYITNFLTDDEKDYAVLGNLLDNCCFNRNHQRYFIDDACPNISLRPSKVHSDEVVLEMNGARCGVLGLSKKYAIEFKKDNYTDLDVIPFETMSFIFRKSYLDSLHDSEPDYDETLAIIEWDIIDENGYYGLSNLNFCKDDVTEEEVNLCLLLALAPCVAFKNKMKSMKSVTNGLALGVISGSIIRTPVKW